MKRRAVVSGSFYPNEKGMLVSSIEAMSEKNSSKEQALGVVSPHAGYMYSGKVACRVFSSVLITDTVIIIGPNHTGRGERFAVYDKGCFQTPLGEIAVDSRLSADIIKRARLLKSDYSAHYYEHSIEAQLPILQFFKSVFKIVPIIAGQGSFDEYIEIAAAVSDSIKESGDRVLIVSSTDMTHYEPKEQAIIKDKKAIDAVLALDAKLLLKQAEKYNITMCGLPAVAIMLLAAKTLGAQKARLVQYQTSGDITNDNSSVVGYAGIIIQ